MIERRKPSGYPFSWRDTPQPWVVCDHCGAEECLGAQYGKKLKTSNHDWHMIPGPPCLQHACGEDCLEALKNERSVAIMTGSNGGPDVQSRLPHLCRNNLDQPMQHQQRDVHAVGVVAAGEDRARLQDAAE